MRVLLEGKFLENGVFSKKYGIILFSISVTNYLLPEIFVKQFSCQTKLIKLRIKLKFSRKSLILMSGWVGSGPNILWVDYLGREGRINISDLGPAKVCIFYLKCIYTSIHYLMICVARLDVLFWQVFTWIRNHG